MSIKPEINEAAKRIVQGVYIISSAHDGKVNAMTAAWVSRASFDPPIITVAVGRGRYTYELIVKSGVFAVSTLSAEQVPLGKHFGLKSGRKHDKFASVDYETKATGSPILKDCAAWMDCRVLNGVDAGDHVVFIGEIIDAWVNSNKETLIYDKDTFFK